MLTASAFFKAPEIAERLSVKVDKVLGWIHSGELRAINVSQKSGIKPRWRISEEDLASFLEQRSSRQNGLPLSCPRRTRRNSPSPVRRFIK